MLHAPQIELPQGCEAMSDDELFGSASIGSEGGKKAAEAEIHSAGGAGG